MNCKCFFIVKEKAGAYCFLGHPGPEASCTSHQAPVKVDPAPLDEEMAGKFERF